MSVLLEEEGYDVLVFDETLRPEVSEQEGANDFLLFDAPHIDSPEVQTRDQDSGTDLLLITSGGPVGPQGMQGIQGVQGPPGINGTGAYYQVFGFASASTLWTIDLPEGLSSHQVHAETYDTNGEPIEGNIRRPTASRIEVDWYYPTAGEVRLFR